MINVRGKERPLSCLSVNTQSCGEVLQTDSEKAALMYVLCRNIRVHLGFPAVLLSWSRVVSAAAGPALMTAIRGVSSPQVSGLV